MEYLMCEKMVLDFCEVHQLLEEKLPIKYDSYKGHINNCGFAVHVFTKQTPFVLKADDISRLFNLESEKSKNYFVVDSWLVNNIYCMTKREGYSLDFIVKNSSIIINYDNGDQEKYDYKTLAKHVYENQHTIFPLEKIKLMNKISG